MIEEILKEIDTCLSNEEYIAALVLSIILPDICGLAEYNNQKFEKGMNRYKKWCEEYVCESVEDRPTLYNHGYFDSTTIYNLRCALCHEGNADAHDETLQPQNFELIWSNNPLNRSSSIIARLDQDDKIVEKSCSIDLRDLCDTLRNAALNYYQNNKQKFTFESFNIKLMSTEQAKVIGLRDYDIVVR